MATNKEKIVYEIEADTSGAESSLDKLENSLDGVGGAAGGVIQTLKGVGVAMKAIATNPIGLVITALAGIFTTLAAAAKRNEKAMENINKVMAYFKGTIDGLLNALGPLVEFLTDKLVKAFENPMQTIKDLGNALLENIINRFKAVSVLGKAITALFEGDFKEAGKLAADAFIQIGTGVENGTDKIVKAGEAIVDFGKSVAENVDKAIDANKRLANSELELLRIQKDFELQQLSFQQRAEEQRQIRDDESRSIEERIEANRELSRVLDEQLQTELNLAERQLQMARDRQLVDGVNVETETELLEARNKIAEINERIHSQRSEQLTNENALIKEQKDLEKEKADEAVDNAKKKADAEKKAAKEVADAEKKLADIKKGLAMDAFALIGNLADEDSAVSKGAAVAQIGINTYEGATKAFADTPFPLNFIAAGLITAAGIKAAADAAAIKIPTRKGSSAGNSSSAPSISMPANTGTGRAPINSFADNMTDDITIDPTGAAFSRQARQPLKAYVVLDDIGQAQNTMDNIKSNSTL